MSLGKDKRGDRNRDRCDRAFVVSCLEDALEIQMLVALVTEVATTRTLAPPCPKGYKLPLA